MSEKKITKAEQRKLDADNKKKFISMAFQAVLNEVAEATAGIPGSGSTVQVKFANQNRYIYINAYGMSAGILIFRDGNVELNLKESCHSPHTEQLFEFSLNEVDQQEFLLQFHELLKWLLPECFENGVADNFHTFMDYVGMERTVDAAYKRMCEEWGD